MARVELGCAVDIEDPVGPDEYGCYSVTVALPVHDMEKAAAIVDEIQCTGRSRKPSHALAYALEALAEKLKKSKE